MTLPIFFAALKAALSVFITRVVRTLAQNFYFLENLSPNVMSTGIPSYREKS